MSDIHKLQELTSIQLAKFFKTEDLNIVVDIEEFSEFEIFELLEQKTQNFETQRVKLLLNDFNRTPNQNNELIKKYTKEADDLDLERFRFEMEYSWPEYIEYESYHNLTRDIGRYEYEIGLLNRKNELLNYIIALLTTKSQQTQIETSKIRPKDGLIYLLTYPDAPKWLKLCVENKLLNNEYQPIEPYTTHSAMAYIADKIIDKIKMKPNGKWQCFASLWDIKPKNLADGMDWIRNKKGTFDYQTNIDDIFK